MKRRKLLYKITAAALSLLFLIPSAGAVVSAEVEPEDIQVIRPYMTGMETVGTTLEGKYTYYDVDGQHGESGTTFRWLRSDTKLGQYTEIEGATDINYTLTQEDAGKYIRFEVTPKSGSLTGEAGQSWMIGPVLTQDQYERINNYFDNDNDYMTNVNTIQTELAERLKGAVYFTADCGNLTGSEYVYVDNSKKAFSEETKPVTVDEKVYAPAGFFTTYLNKEAPNVDFEEVSGVKYYDLEAAVFKLGKELWDGNKIQSEIANFQMEHLGQGLIVISDTKDVFDPVKDRDLIDEACNMLYTLRATDEQMEWFRAAKYGMFIHWDPSSIRGVEISWDRQAFRPGDIGSSYYNSIDNVYDTQYKQFNPTEYDPDEWMQLAKEAGMKYVVLTTKHHGSFSNFISEFDNYTIEYSPYEGDIVGEYVEAARKAGLKIGFYYSARDWYNPNYLTADHHRYLEYYFGQVQELLSNYGKIDIMWFDSIGSSSWNQWDPRTLLRRMKQLQPDLIVNNRYTSVLGTYDVSPYDINGDWYTPEHRLGGFDSSRPWESCMCVAPAPGGGWSWRPDVQPVSVEESVKYLINNTVNDGNLLYDIGPKSDGTLDEDQAQVFRDVGAWLKPYEEAIYNTRGGPYENPQWGGSTYRTNEDGTQTIYLHVTPLLHNYTPADNTLQIAEPSNGQVYGNAVLLKDNIPVSIEKNKDGYLLALPEGTEWDELDTVIKLEADLGETLGKQIDEAKALSESMTDDMLEQVKATLGDVIAEAETILSQEKEEEYSATLLKLNDEMERASAAMDLNQMLGQAQEKLDSVSVGNDPWQCPQNLHDQLSRAISSGKDLLKDEGATEQMFADSVADMKITISALDDIMNGLKITFNPGQGKVQKGTEISLSSPYDELIIRYTLDGTEPEAESPVYDGKSIIMEGKSLVVKAALYDSNGKQVGGVQEQTYLNVSAYENIAVQNSSVQANTVYGSGYEGKYAVDNNSGTRWATPDGTITANLELDFDEPKTVNAMMLEEYVEGSETTRISSYAVEYWDAGSGMWKQAYKGTTGGTSKAAVFESVTSDRFRLNVLACMNVTIWEFSLYDLNGTNIQEDNLALGATASASGIYSEDYSADKAVDGNQHSRWATQVSEDGTYWLQLDLKEEVTFDTVKFSVYSDKEDPENYEVYKDFELQYEKDGEWITFYDSSEEKPEIVFPVYDGTEQYDNVVWVDSSGKVKQTEYTAEFKAITASSVRLYSNNTSKDPSVIEFEMYALNEEQPVEPDNKDNLASGATASASGVYSADYSADKAVDSNQHSRWATQVSEDGTYWLQLDLKEEVTFDTVKFSVYSDKEDPENYEVYKDFELQYEKDGEWITFYDSAGTKPEIVFPVYDGTEEYDNVVWVDSSGNVKQTEYTAEFEAVTASRVRLYSDNTSKDPSIIEFEMYALNEEPPSEPVDKDALTEEVSEAGKLLTDEESSRKYEKAALDSLKETLESANAILEDDTVSQDTVDKAAETLKAAVTSVYESEKNWDAYETALKEGAAVLKDIEAGKYEDESAQAYVAAYNAVKDLPDEATQDEIDAAVQKLSEAGKLLKEKEETDLDGGDKDTGDGDGNNNPGGGNQDNTKPDGNTGTDESPDKNQSGGNVTDNDGTYKAVQTGDTTNVAVPIFLMAVAAAAIVLVLKKRIR